jgi:hypothetical protein
MNATASKKRELPERNKKPSTYLRIVTEEDVNGKSVVQSDDSLPAAEPRSKRKRGTRPSEDRRSVQLEGR